MITIIILLSWFHSWWIFRRSLLWSPSDSISYQVSRTLLSILADLNNAEVWIITIRPPISNFSSSLSNPCQVHQSQLVPTSPSCSTSFFSSLARSKYLPLFSFSLIFTPWSARSAKLTIQVLFFSWLWRGRASWPWSGDHFFLRIPKIIMSLIFFDGFWFVFIVSGTLV